MAIFQKSLLFSLLFSSVFCFAFQLKAQQGTPALPQNEELREAEAALGKAAMRLGTVGVAIGAHEAVEHFINPARFVRTGLKHIPFIGNYLATMATDTIVTIEAVQLIFSQWQLHYNAPLKTRIKLCLQRCTQLAEILVLLAFVGVIGSYCPEMFTNITSNCFSFLKSIIGSFTGHFPYCLKWLAYPLKALPYIPYILCNIVGWTIINGLATRFNPIAV